MLTPTVRWDARAVAGRVGAAIVSGDPDSDRMSLDAPAGSGKSTALVRLAVPLQREHGMESVALLSFTRSAVQGLRKKLVDLGQDDGCARTLHSLCARLLGLGRQPEAPAELEDLEGPFLDFRKQEHRRAFVSEVIPDRASLYRGAVGVDEDPYLQIDEYARLRRCAIDEALVLLRADRRGLSLARARAFTHDYRSFRERHGLQDYTDILELALEARPYLGAKFVLADEAQDWSPLEWAVLDALSWNAEIVIAAGDAAQAIYGHRGARVREFLNFGGARLQFQVSHRIPSRLLPGAMHLASLDPNLRSRLDVRSASEGGRVRLLRDLEDVTWTGRSYLVLARNRWFVRKLERELEDLGVPFTGVCGGGVPTEGTVRDALLTLRDLARDAFVPFRDLKNLHRIVPRRLWPATSAMDDDGPHDSVPIEALTGLGATTELVTAIRTGEPWRTLGVSDRLRRYLHRVAARWGVDALTDRPHVRTNTIHGAKGDEAAVVVIAQDWSRASYEDLCESGANEHRVAHVAWTRASEMVLLVPPRSRRTYPFPQPRRWFAPGEDVLAAREAAEDRETLA